jgi:hypothetical protein
MKYLLLIICLFLTGCMAFIAKKATVLDEGIIRQQLKYYTLQPGTAEYFGTTIFNARYICGRAWHGNTLGYFVMLIDPGEGKIETHWSADGEFYELNNRVFIDPLPGI